VCSPLCEPLTTIVPNWLVGSPRNAICACGEITRLPGTGNTLTPGTAADAAALLDSMTSAVTAAVAARTITDLEVLKLIRDLSAVRPDSIQHAPGTVVAPGGR
jgi:hypothetical protein